MFTEGIYPIGDGLLDIDEKRLQGLLVSTDINEIYDVEQTPFARGKFAAVRRAIHKNSGVHFAAKFLKRRRRAQSSDKEIKHEIAVLMLCQDEENIVKLNAVHETRSDTALLLELATGGELQTFLDNEDCLSEAHARICMREVLKALQFLHKRSIAHLDLKPQNILLTGERIEDGLKLCDFGISRVVAEGTNVREIVGTPDYVAPEVLQYEPLSLLTDIWSVGVLAYVLLTGFSPFGGETKQETFLNISQCALTFPDKLFDGVSAAAIDFIRQALRIKPSERMTAAGCLEHYWLKDECSIDRQLFNGIANKQANVNVDELDVDATDEEEDEEDEEVIVDVDQQHENQEDEAQDISIDDDEEDEHEQQHQQNGKVELSITTSTNNLDNNPIIGCKMDSSDTDIDLFTTTTETSPNTSTVHLSNGTASPAQCTKTAPSPSPSPLAAAVPGRARSGTRPAIPAKPTTTTTTAILTLPPAARATTIPLYNVQQSHLPPTHQQQQHYITARRQSSESNKENTFLATKKIATNSHAIKKPIQAITAQTPSTPGTTTTTTIATIMIGSPELEEDSTMHNGSYESSGNIVTTTITLPNGDRNKQQQQQCLFPDAPTTPKVIRKAPTTDTSPTSVKALVKKFQLETGKQLSEKHLKEAQLNQQHMHAAEPTTVRRSSTNTMPTATAITAAAPLVNGKHSATGEQKSTTSNNTTTTANKQTKFVHSNSVKETATTTVSHNGTTATRSTRRASEPITGVHKKSTAVIALQPRHSVSSSTGGNYKSTCVFGIGCNGRSSNGVITSLAHNECRHLSNCNNNNSSSSKATSPSTAVAKGTASASSSSSSTAAAALLLSSHHHHQLHQQHHPHHHHHHHHHGVAKSATNNLSMDQGIIC